MITGQTDIALRVVVVLPGRETDKTVSVSLETDAGVVVYAAELTHVGSGRYEDSGYTPTEAINLTAFFSVQDFGGTPSLVYGDFSEDVVITDGVTPWSGSVPSVSMTTLARIRALAGFRAKRINENIGTGNGVTTTFAPRTATVFISPTGDNPSLSEITVYVDGIEVVATAISEAFVTLEVPPADESTVSAIYYGHNLSNIDVSQIRSQVEAEVFGKLSSMYTFDDLTTSPVAGKVVSYLGAAMLADEAYNDAGANTPGTVFPPDRLRRVATALLGEVLAGTLVLVDETYTEIPVVSEIDSWLDETSYGDRDRLFEHDPFYANEDGTLDRSQGTSAWRWDA